MMGGDEAAAAGLLGTSFNMGLPSLRECFALDDDFLTAMVFWEELAFDLPIFY